MMKLIVLLSLLASASAVNISASCELILDPATEVLSGQCDDGQIPNNAWQPVSLDLNKCLAYDAEQSEIIVSNLEEDQK